MLPSLKRKESAGGLAFAILNVLKKYGGIWCGWSGEVKTTKKPSLNVVIDGNIEYATTNFSKSDYDKFYNGYCNDILWPLLHYRLDLRESQGSVVP